MKKLIVKFAEGYVNTPATHMAERDGIVYVYRGDDLIGAFDLGYVDAIYLI